MGVLAGRTALVTGAARGIGRAVALRLARDGAFVIVHYATSGEAAAAVLAEMRAAGGDGFTACADLASADAVAPLFAVIDAGLAAAGRRGIDILVNNAGVGMMRDLDQITPAEFDWVMAVNVRAPLFVAQAAARRMGLGGRIVNISSMTATRAYGGAFVAYGASKAALDYLTLAMAAALGPRGITVNAVAPGATATDFVGDMMAHPEIVARVAADAALGAVGRPEDVADAVALAASPDARWITGECIRASGGTLL